MEDNYTRIEEDKELIETAIIGKVSSCESKSDQIYDDIGSMKVMIKSEGLISEINLLLIWGSKFPKDKDIAENVIHYAKIEIDNLTKKGKFRVIYFHSGVKGNGGKIPKMIK